VFHLAGASDVNEVAADPVGAVRLNVEGTARVLAAARRQRCERVLLASTVWLYGATRGEGERTEDAPVDLARAGHVYVSTKIAAELLVHSYREMYGQRFTILRYGIPYGPRMRDVLVVARFVRAALEGEPITIAGTGEQQRNYVYVEDLADAHVRALSPAAADQVLALEGDTPLPNSSGRCRSSTCPPGPPTTREWVCRTGGPRRCLTGRRRPRSWSASGAISTGSPVRAARGRRRDCPRGPAEGVADETGAAAVRLARSGT
jgi:hypothetical protein